MLTLRHSLYHKHLKKHQLKMAIWYLKIKRHKIKQMEVGLNNRMIEQDNRTKSQRPMVFI